MKLYNVSLPEDSKIEVFKPRVPSFRAKGENDVIPRICLSSSLSGCISAVVWGGINFENMIIDLGEEPKHYPIKVYEFDSKYISKENIITPEELYEKDLVRDATINEEYWVINQDLKPSREFYITVKDYVEEVVDSISYANLKEMDRLEYLGEHYDCDDYIEGTFTKIIVEDFEYINKEDLVIGDTFKIPLSEISDSDNEFELCDIISDIFNNCVVLNNSVNKVYRDVDNIIIETDEFCSILYNDVIKEINKEIAFIKS